MEHYSYECDHERTSLIPISSSILFHILLLFLLLYITVDRTQLQDIVHHPSKLFAPPDHTLAALKPKASPFGLPTHFVSTTFDDDQEDNKPPDPHEEAQTSYDTQSLTDESKKSVESEEDQILIQKLNQTTGYIKSQEPPPSKKDSPSSSIKSEETSLPQKIKKKRVMPRQKVPPQKRPISFADLAQGFIENIKNEGNDWLERQGDPNKRPDQEDLKKISYMQKIIWYMQNEWKIEQDKIEHQITTNLIVTVLITIKQDGHLASVKIVHPSGNAVYDQFMIDGIKRASPYPPVPRYLNTSAFDLELSIYCTQQQKPNAQLQSYTL